jgi:predicted permease
MGELVRDLRQCGRGFHRRPGFAVAVVATLALGIGVVTAVFSVVNAVLLEPLPYAESDRLVALFTHEIQKGGRRNPSSPADFLAWRNASGRLEQMTAAHPWSPVLTGRGQPEPIRALKATPSLFALLRAEAALGQVFGASDSGREGHAVVVLGHALWRRRFGADPRIVGQALTLDGAPYVVAGVMPPGFRFPPFWAVGAEMWTPLRLEAGAESNHGRFLRVFARLVPGATLQAARSEMALVDRRLAAEDPAAHVDTAVNVEALREPVVSRARPALLALFGAVGFVLLIAGANVTSLLLARGLAREKEVAVRAALGAGGARLLALLLTESTSLAMAGGLLGLGIARLGVEALRAFAPEGLPRQDEIHLDARVVAFGVAISLLTGLLTGLVPARRAARGDLGGALKRGDRLTASGPSRLHDALVVAQFGLAVVLLVGAGLLIKSVHGLLHPEPGFRTERLLTMSLALSGSPFAEPETQGPFLDAVLEGVGRVPGVLGAAFVNHLPIGGDTWGTEFAVEGGATPADDPPSATFRVASTGYLTTIGIPLLRGRAFGSEDRPGSPGVVLVNASLARRFWPEEDPVERRIRRGGPDSKAPWSTVVGVFGDTRQSSLTEPVRPEILFPYAQNPVPWHKATTLLVHTRVPPASVADAVKAEVWRLAPDLPVTDVRPMDRVLGETVSQERFGAILLGGFAASALLLAAVGLYAVMAYVVSTRRREIGIRMALGAGAREVFSRALGRGLALAGVGSALGLACALALSRVLGHLAFGVSPTDPSIFVAAPLVLVAAGVAASAVPARRASRVDPLVALRGE